MDNELDFRQDQLVWRLKGGLMTMFFAGFGAGLMFIGWQWDMGWMYEAGQTLFFLSLLIFLALRVIYPRQAPMFLSPADLKKMMGQEGKEDPEAKPRDPMGFGPRK